MLGFFRFLFELVVYRRSLNPSRIYIEISKNCLQLSASKLLNSLSRSFFFKLWKNKRWSEWPTHWKERTGIEGNNINTIAQMKKTLLAWQSQKYMYWLFFPPSQSLCCNYCHFMWARSSVCCVSIFFSSLCRSVFSRLLLCTFSQWNVTVLNMTVVGLFDFREEIKCLFSK